MINFHKRPVLVAIELLGAAMLLAACGGSDDAATSEAEANDANQAVASAKDNASAEHAAAQRANAAAAEAGTGPTLTDPVEESDEATLSAARETAQATTYATPKVAALEFTWNVSAAQQTVLAKYGYVIVDKGRLRGPGAYNTFVNGIKSRNPNTKVAEYVINQELRCNAGGDRQFDGLIASANAADFWLRYSNGSRAQWTTSYNACDINVTAWGKRAANGQTWASVKWQSDRNAYFGPTPRLDYAMIDTLFYRGRTTSNWKRNGQNLNPGNADIAASYRAGQAAYITELRRTNPGLMVSANPDHDLSYPEYRGLLNGAWLEAEMGKYWSTETLKGWSGTLARYRSAIANTRAPKDVVYEAIGGQWDYRAMRYGLGTALMDNGYFMYRTLNWVQTPLWYDEYSAQIGTATQGPPTGPAQNGIWTRTFQNGIVLINPQTRSATITIPALYKRISGSQAPSHNNGAWQNVITLGPKDALVMVRR